MKQGCANDCKNGRDPDSALSKTDTRNPIHVMPLRGRADSAYAELWGSKDGPRSPKPHAEIVGPGHAKLRKNSGDSR